MPDTSVLAAPFVLEHPHLHLGATGSSVDISCPGTNLVAEPSQDENTTTTFCGTYTSYKSPKWTITVTVAQSYGADGSWTLIQPLCGTIQPFELRPDVATASIDNPVMSGDCYVGALPFISAAPGEVSEVDLVLGVQGDPLFGIVSPAAAAASASK